MYPRIRVAIIGLGYRGCYLLQMLRALEVYEVVALADPALEATIYPDLEVYADGPEDYQRMLLEQTLDLVVIASPWSCQREQAEVCLRSGVHLALEIKGGLTEYEYEEIIALSQARDLRVYPLENTLFMREVMAVWELVRQGVLGEVIHLRGGYRHDLRQLLFSPSSTPHWRRTYYEQTNGDLYPTHGLAPLCLIAGLGRGEHPRRLTAFASKSRGVAAYLARSGGDSALDIKTGDIVVTQIETDSGILLSLTHDTTLPRPKSLDYEVQGTKGLWQGEGRRIYLEGISPQDEWEDDRHYIEQYDHPYWQAWGEAALSIDRHHRGMDYLMLRTLAGDLMGQATYPADIHDLAFWCSITPLSARSIAQRQTIELENALSLPIITQN